MLARRSSSLSPTTRNSGYPMAEAICPTTPGAATMMPPTPTRIATIEPCWSFAGLRRARFCDADTVSPGSTRNSLIWRPSRSGRTKTSWRGTTFRRPSTYRKSVPSLPLSPSPTSRLALLVLLFRRRTSARSPVGRMRTRCQTRACARRPKVAPWTRPQSRRCGCHCALHSSHIIICQR